MKSGLGDLIPSNYPIAEFNKTSSMVKKIVDSKNLFDISTLFPDAWMGSSYRFITASKHNENFRNSMINPNLEYPQINHYRQEKEIFGFFVNCLSSIECLFVSCYLVARIINRNSFPIDNFKDITITHTYHRFQENFPSDEITKFLKHITREEYFINCKFIRNYQAHRMLLQQKHEVNLFPPQQSNTPPKISWIAGDIQIETETLSSYQSWLIDISKIIFTNVRQFLTR